MLNKVKVIAIVGLTLGALRAVAPGLNVGEEFQAAVEGLVNALFVIVPVAAGWFARETKETRDALKLKPASG